MKKAFSLLLPGFLLTVAGVLSVFALPSAEKRAPAPGSPAAGPEKPLPPGPYESIVLGGGCFWCVEAVYERIPGVVSAVSGYAGGDSPNPNYEEVSTGRTGHAEVVKITYAPAVISLEKILDLFWKAHDPTTKDRQGADIGPQYRSIILYAGETQKRAAEISKKELDRTKLYSLPAVTEIVPLKAFYEAEDYHQDYYEKNPFAGYCQVVIRPKLDKLGLETAPLPLPKR